MRGPWTIFIDAPAAGPSSINVQFATFAADEEDLSIAALFLKGDMGVGG